MPKGIKGFQKGHSVSEETRRKIGKANSSHFFAICDYCGKLFQTRPSHFKRKHRHFCSQTCYSAFRKEILPFHEQASYKGVRKPGETKQVYHRNYCIRHKENMAHLKARRYAREKGATGQHTKVEWESLKITFDNRCAICGKKKPLTKDHIVPLSQGGTDDIENIQPLCRNCNSTKHTLTFGHLVLPLTPS